MSGGPPERLAQDAEPRSRHGFEAEAGEVVDELVLPVAEEDEVAVRQPPEQCRCLLAALTRISAAPGVPAARLRRCPQLV